MQWQVASASLRAKDVYKRQPVDSPNFGGKRALLVEDNEINREIARTLLEEAGVEVEEACDGEAAVCRVSEAGPGYYLSLIHI